MSSHSLYHRALDCLQQPEPEQKCRLTAATVDALRAGKFRVGSGVDDLEVPLEPGRPARPALVPPRDLPRRRLNCESGRAALLHALAHIEFNAINLAWDAVLRFGDMPDRFYHDWAEVAGEEAYHFQLLRRRLGSLGHDYGDFSAHGGLWEMAVATRHDVMHRMALVPRVLEARGLDVTPGMMERLRAAGDAESADILEVILRDEIGHVDIGTRWFRYLCAQRKLDPHSTFTALVGSYLKGSVRGPFNRTARESAGFTSHELEALAAMDQ
jgi:uncharacterized ferritin-like protein (DUF455 family)